MASTHLVVGAGAVGSALALQLVASGAEVTVVTRSGGGPSADGIRRVAADASSVEELLAALPTADAIHNCANPPYHRWPQQWPPMAAAFLGYAERTGAVLVTCSNLYGYGPVDGPLTDDLPLAAPGVKGRVRARMWQDAKAAHDAGRVRATEVRGSDYLCEGAQSRMGDRVMPRVLAGKAVQVVGRTDTAHTWTAPSDVARLMAVAAADPRAWGSAWHVMSNPARTQREVVDELADSAGVSRVKVSSVPAALLRGLGLFNPAIRELRETDYQFARPYLLDDSRTRSVLGLAPTPWATLLADQVAAYR